MVDGPACAACGAALAWTRGGAACHCHACAVARAQRAEDARGEALSVLRTLVDALPRCDLCDEPATQACDTASFGVMLRCHPHRAAEDGWLPEGFRSALGAALGLLRDEENR